MGSRTGSPGGSLVFRCEVAQALQKLTRDELGAVSMYFRAWSEQEANRLAAAGRLDLEDRAIGNRMRVILEDPVARHAFELLGDELGRRLWC